MVELFKRTREVPKRNVLTTRLFRMASRGAIYNVPGKKGVYSTYELSEADAKRMFGGDKPESDPAPAATPEAPPSAPAPSPSPEPRLPRAGRSMPMMRDLKRTTALPPKY
jgi:hypothetical protein